MKLAVRTLLSTVALVALVDTVSAQPLENRPSSRPQPVLFATRPSSEAGFRPLALLNDRLVLRGELASDERSLFLTQAEALRANAVRVAYRNAVSNLPDTSRVLVLINDQTIGEVRLDATNRQGLAILPIPLGVMTAGHNAIRFVASQRHRVDCSVNATYELWSEISLSESGLIGLSVAAAPRRLADLPALAASGSERTPIRVRTSATPDTLEVDRAMRAVNAVVLAASIQRPQVEMSPEAGEGAGIDLIIGADAPAGAIQLESDLGLFSSADPETGRTTLTVRSIPGVDVETTIRRLTEVASASAPTGSSPGRRALANTKGRAVHSGSSFSFAELGVETRIFDGRMQQSSFGFKLPSDFFAAPYGSASLLLDSSFLGEAGPGKQISIRVNDQIAAVVPIHQRGPGEADQRRIELPMQMFKPGANSVAVEAHLAPVDSACDATVAPTSPARLAINGSSRIGFGQLAKVSVLPNLSATLAHGYPYSAQDDVTTVAVSASDPRYLSAAMTWIGRMTAVSGKPLAAAFRFGSLDVAGASGLFFGPPSEAAQTLARQPATPTSVAAASAVDAPAPTALQPAVLPGAQDTRAPSSLRAISDRLHLTGWVQSVGDVLRGDVSGISMALQDFGLLERPRAAARAAASSASAGPADLTVLQEVSLLAQREPWQNLFGATQVPPLKTMVLAADPSQLEALIETATSAHFWTRFNGESAVVRTQSWGPENHAAAAQVYIGSGDFSPSNLRLTLAGWFALNQRYYLAGLAALSLLLALSTAAVLRTRRL